VSGNRNNGNDNRDGVKRRINPGNTTDAECCGHVLKFYFNVVQGILLTEYCRNNPAGRRLVTFHAWNNTEKKKNLM
jgi:hypothetical protein